MRKSHRLQTHYRRALWAGLAVSVVAHGLILAFTHFKLGLPDSGRQRTSLALLDLDIPEEEQVMEIVELTELSAAGTEAAMAISDIPGTPNSSASDMAFPAPDAMNEAAYILARASSAHLEYAVVPRPKVTPMTVETAFAPLNATAEATQLAINIGDARKSRGRRGGGIRISIGAGGRCPLPSTTLINRQTPDISQFSRLSPAAGGFQISGGVGGSFRVSGR